METALSRAQMVPSGGFLRAKMAPAGTQMGSGNLINAGIVSTQWTEKEGEKGKNTHTHKATHVCARTHTHVQPFTSTKDKAIWYH